MDAVGKRLFTVEPGRFPCLIDVAQLKFWTSRLTDFINKNTTKQFENSNLAIQRVFCKPGGANPGVRSF